MTSSILGIGLYAPAGFVTDAQAIERAVAMFEDLGHRVVVDPTVATRWERFSASDEERLAAVMRMAADPHVDIAIAVRGGYGWSRLLDRLDFAAIATTRTRWVGHSDFTAFQLALLARSGQVSFAGPMASYDFGAERPSTFTRRHFWELLAAVEYAVEFAVEGPSRCSLEGTLWGGNLAMVAHLAGTRHLPRLDDGILFLEDIGETPYRIERMLYQLKFAGIIERQQAILLGTFNGFEPGPNDNGYGLSSAIEQARRVLDVPIYTGLPFGHCRDKLTLPVGGRCALQVSDGAARLRFSRYAV
jgi:muramoyltetrapeptide carboxypeptidase